MASPARQHNRDGDPPSPSPKRLHQRSSRPRRALRARRDSLLAAREAAVDWLFNRRSLALALGRDHVLCLGDSHVAVMSYVSVPRVWFRVKAVLGATASGVTNPQSTTNSLAVFTALLRAAKPWQQVLLQLGEVDCGFVIWRRAMRRNLSMEEQLVFTIDSYAAFIEKVLEHGFRRVIVLSVSLPTIGDDPSKWGEVATLRKTVTASQLQRTELTLRFNAALRERCDALGVTFVDVTTGHLDAATGLVDDRFVRETHLDHHLADAPYAELISGELTRLWRRG